MTADHDKVLETAADWLAKGHPVALATVIKTWGSAPRPTGSQLAVRKDGTFVGSVSGGCVEGAVITEAIDAITDGKPRKLSFGVTNDEAWQVGLACGGQIEIFVERVDDKKRSTLDTIDEAPKYGHSLVLATRLDGAVEHLIVVDGPKQVPNEALMQAAVTASRRDQSASVDIDGHTWFLNVFNPSPKLYIVGAVHIAQPLSQIAAQTAFDVTVIDPRTAFASSERFPNLHLITAWPDEALADLPLDSRTAVVTLTHDPKLDDPALIAALRSEAFYVGALGSKKTHAARAARLKAAGFDDAAFARIRGPVGLDIGAVSPAEIAVSIMAQIIETLRGPKSA